MTEQIKNKLIFMLSGLLLFAPIGLFGQNPSETPPPPSKAPSVTIPEVKEMTLPNGLKVVVVQRKGLPLVTASLLVKRGANYERETESGLAAMTASLLVKGSGYRTATDLAEQIEFLGGSIQSRAGWNSSTVTINATGDSLGSALSIMSDSAVRPAFPEKEIRLLKKQTLDDFNISVKQPRSLLGYVASRYTFGEHLSGGTPQTVKRISRRKIAKFHSEHYRPEYSVLIFTGDISEKSAFGYARLFFGGWQRYPTDSKLNTVEEETPKESVDMKSNATVKRMLVIDLPDSGQAAVGYRKKLEEGRIICESEDTINNNCLTSSIYYPASVLNSILGGGYSARLNQEIRLKRGLSYGAGSGFGWRSWDTNFSATAQTKNESAAHVAELMRIEIEKLAGTPVSSKEIVPRKAVLTGGFGRGLQTNSGLAARLRGLYLHNISPDELNVYMNKVNAVSEEQVKEFASSRLTGGDIIIVGDSKMFLEDLQKRFPNQTIEVIKAADVNLNSKTLRTNNERRGKRRGQ